MRERSHCTRFFPPNDPWVRARRGDGLHDLRHETDGVHVPPAHLRPQVAEGAALRDGDSVSAATNASTASAVEPIGENAGIDPLRFLLGGEERRAGVGAVAASVSPPALAGSGEQHEGGGESSRRTVVASEASW